jgi:hypothetical protein
MIRFGQRCQLGRADRRWVGRSACLYTTRDASVHVFRPVPLDEFGREQMMTLHAVPLQQKSSLVDYSV